MEDIWMKGRRASFTVEAVFVMNITVFVLAAICYLAVYSHDKTAMYSMVHNYLEKSAENGDECKESEMERYLAKHLFLCRIDHISVKKKILSVSVGITYHAEVQIPFVKGLLDGGSGRNIQISHGVLCAADYMWDGGEVKNLIK